MVLLKIISILILAIISLQAIYGYRKREIARLQESFQEWLKTRND